MNEEKTQSNEIKYSPNVQKFFDNLQTSRQFLKEVFDVLTLRCLGTLEKSRAELKGLVRKFTKVDYVCGGLSLAALFAASLVMLLGVGILGYQVILWLKSGVWTELPLLVAFEYLFKGTAIQHWLSDPGSWLGLHQVVEWVLENVPLSLTLIVQGGVGILVMAGVIALALSVRFYQFKRLNKI